MSRSHSQSLERDSKPLHLGDDLRAAAEAQQRRPGGDRQRRRMRTRSRDHSQRCSHLLLARPASASVT